MFEKLLFHSIPSLTSLTFLFLTVASTQADVFNMGGTRNADGTWTGPASLETVTVGDVGNAGELCGKDYGGSGPNRICGAVDYAYNIGKYEVTEGQYAEFLNAVGGVDTHGLYSTLMSEASTASGISRSGGGTVSDPYVYSVNASFVNRPVVYVTFWRACRFANWLHNGQPTGAQGAGTTETGAYTLNGYNGFGGGTIHRNEGAKWFVPNEDEWYKAAYYKGGVNAGYWDYPTCSDSPPGQSMADSSGNNANYYTAPYACPIDAGKYTTLVGEFQNSESPYGTFDQGGNVTEWNETVIYSIVDGTKYPRGERGGGYGQLTKDMLPAAMRSLCHTVNTSSWQGFRVAGAVPEPSALALLSMSAIGLLLQRRRH